MITSVILLFASHLQMRDMLMVLFIHSHRELKQRLMVPSAVLVLMTLGWPNILIGNCAGDINRDGIVDLLDLERMNTEIGRSNCTAEPPCQSDLNGDGTVNSDDRDMLRSELGRKDCLKDREEGETDGPGVIAHEVEERESTMTTATAQKAFVAAERGGEPRIARFTDNGDRTITDRETGLMWTKDANVAGDTMLFHQALFFIDEMNRGKTPNFGHSDWRLPHLQELRTLVDYTHFTAMGHGLPPGHPFEHVQSLRFETYYLYPTYLWGSQLSWFASLYCRVVGSNAEACVGYVWPVRGGK